MPPDPHDPPLAPDERVRCLCPGSWVDGRTGRIKALDVVASDGVEGHLLAVDGPERASTVVPGGELERLDGLPRDGRVVLSARVPMRRVAWAGLRPGDVVYYGSLWMGGESGVTARGPFRVADPAARTVVNTSGVELPCPKGVTLLVPDFPGPEPTAVVSAGPPPRP
jgi:hypothetical protein